MTPRRRLLLAGALSSLIVAGLIVGARTGWNPPELRTWAERRSIGLAGLSHKIPQWTWGIGDLCVTPDGTVDVTGVTLDEGHGIHVIAFGFRNLTGRKQRIGGLNDAMTNHGYTVGPQALTSACSFGDDDPNLTGWWSLAIEAELIDRKKWGHAEAVTVHYTSRGLKRTVTLPTELTICPETVTKVEDCHYTTGVD